MDRFIVTTNSHTQVSAKILKSNMDRFIVCKFILMILKFMILKSNMDRFIVVTLFFIFQFGFFKIQYG